ncbi:MAG: DUF4139 domain-containing protein [Bacteroidales bacterium]
MKHPKLLLMMVACAGLVLTASANEPKKVSSKIDKVTVFLQGAQIMRSASVSIQPGTTDIIFEGVSPNLNTGSLQAGGRGSFVVMGVRYNTEYTPPGTKKENAVPASLMKKIEMTQDTLSQMDFETETLNYRLQAWTTEKNMLERNKLITGEGKTDSLALFIQAMEYYRKKIHEINEKIVEVKMEQKKMNRRRAEITVRLNELLNYKSQLERDNVTQESYSYQVIVTVSSKASASGTVTINYLVGNASWVPFYELRAENSSQPVNMHYKAHISQNTGEEWKDVKLTLSTMNPQRQHIKPTLVPWVLRYFQPQAQYGYIQSNAAIPLSQGVIVTNAYTNDESVSTKAMKAPAQSLSAYTQQTINFSNVEFDIELPYSIPSDGKSHQVTVLEEKIDAQYKHYIVPKMEQEVYLMARLTGWEKLNLLPGNANIYFLNTIIGSTQINPNTINDTLNIALGKDPGISVTRKKLKDKESTKVLSNNIEKEIIIEITVRNKKDEKAEIQIEDQIPVSAEEDVKVRFTKETLAGAELNENTGALTWNITMKPKESKTITFSYIISYPKDKNLQI